VLVPPTLVVEAVGMGHESHDQETKRHWYAEAGARNYWIIDPFKRTMECLVLSGSEFVTDQRGQNDDELRPSLFPGLVIPLARLWA
jgi:Uma2 family endonuclease